MLGWGPPHKDDLILGSEAFKKRLKTPALEERQDSPS